MRNTSRKTETTAQHATPPPQPAMLQLATVELDKLQLNRVYQRETSARFIKKIIEEGFDHGLANVILISGKTNNILDGGHRVMAAREIGITELPALVYHGLSEEQEARYFSALNRERRPVGLKTRHKAALAYREQNAIQAEEIIRTVSPKRMPLQTVVAANRAHPGVLATLAPHLAQMDTTAFSRDFLAGIVHLTATEFGGRLPERLIERLVSPGMYRQIVDAIRQVMREHMFTRRRSALPTDWSVKAEGVKLALETKLSRIPITDVVPE